MAVPKPEVTVSQSVVNRDLEKATPAGGIDSMSNCRPTISIIDVHVNGTTQRYPRSLRKDEDSYIASLPPLAPKSTRIYLREEDCRARDAFASQAASILQTAIPHIQFFLQYVHSLQRRFEWARDSTSGLVESTVARALENSGVDRWWSVHEADKFDVLDLRNLFDDKCQETRRFLVQLNVEASQVHERAILAPPEDTGMIRKKLHTGRSKGDTTFWEKYAALEVRGLEAEDSFEVHCWFPALSFAQLPEKLADEYVFPLLTDFEQLLLSDNSSVPSKIEDAAMIQSYIVLDYLRCVTLSWVNFLKRVNHASSLPPSRVLTQFEHENNRHITATLQNSINDLEACVVYILDRTTVSQSFASAGHSVSQIPNERSSRNHLHMVQDLKAQLGYLSRRSTSLREHSQQLFELNNAATSNIQAQSAGRLTVVASIFLPLTLAASLLAMNVPAASIGRLWYDFAGMCVCLAFISFACYSVYRKLQFLRQSDSTVGAWFSLDAAVPEESDLRFKMNDFIIFWGLPIVISASFLAGMFNSFGVALDALKYGLPILVGIMVLCWIIAFTRDIIPNLYDILVTGQFAMNIYQEKQKRDASSTATNTQPQNPPVSSNSLAEQSSGANTIPHLNKKVHDKELRELLLAIAEAMQNLNTNRSAGPDKLLVGLMEQVIREFEKLDKLSKLDD